MLYALHASGGAKVAAYCPRLSTAAAALWEHDSKPTGGICPGIPLAEATARYEQGMILVQRCNKLLDQAELKITSLKDAYAQDPGGPLGDGLDEEEV